MTWWYMAHQGESFGHPQCTSSLFLVYPPLPHTTQALAAQGSTQGSWTEKYGVFHATGDSRGYRECSVPTLVTTK